MVLRVPVSSGDEGAGVGQEAVLSETEPSRATEAMGSRARPLTSQALFPNVLRGNQVLPY